MCALRRRRTELPAFADPTLVGPTSRLLTVVYRSTPSVIDGPSGGLPATPAGFFVVESAQPDGAEAVEVPATIIPVARVAASGYLAHLMHGTDPLTVLSRQPLGPPRQPTDVTLRPQVINALYGGRRASRLWMEHVVRRAVSLPGQGHHKQRPGIDEQADHSGDGEHDDHGDVHSTPEPSTGDTLGVSAGS